MVKEIVDAIKAVAFEISLLRKQVEKLDRTLEKLNEAPAEFREMEIKQ